MRSIPSLVATVAPTPPKSTFASDRFIARHMIRVRTMPEAPTSAPAMISPELLSTNPVAQAARPE